MDPATDYNVIDYNVIKYIHRYAFYADYINTRQRFEWICNRESIVLRVVSTDCTGEIGTTTIMRIDVAIFTYSVFICGFVSDNIDIDDKRGPVECVLDFVRDVLAKPEDAFYGTLTPISNECKQRIVFNEIASFLRGGSKEKIDDAREWMEKYAPQSSLMPIPFAGDDISEMRPQGIMWINIEGVEYDICVRDVFSTRSVVRIMFDTWVDGFEHEMLESYWVRVFSDGDDEIVEIQAENIADVTLRESEKRTLLQYAGKLVGDVHANVIVNQIQRLLSHDRATELFDPDTINECMRDILGSDIVRTDAPVKDYFWGWRA